MNVKLFWRFLIVSGLVLAILFGVYVYKFSKPRLVFCDVGQGTGVLATMGEFQFVYDTGPKNGKFLSCLSRNMPFWDKCIEVVVISHWDSDHSGGLDEVDDYYKIDKLFSSQNNEQYSYSRILALNDSLTTSWMEFWVVWTDEKSESNYGSVVAVLTIGELKSLLMGDVPIEVEEELLWSRVKRDMGLAEKLKDVDVILVGHHGSKNSTGKEWLEFIKPKEAVISVGDNKFGHPSNEVLDRLTTAKVDVYRTDIEGDIVFTDFKDPANVER